MTQETNNEIDLMLRRLSRGQGASGPDGDLRVDTDHLDADELSAFSENALPAVARARYTAHLAECSRCRELVVQLSSAAGVVLAEESAPVAGPSGLRKFLASLFSPMVLRYAVPAMGLIVVAFIGFAVFRNEAPPNTDVAVLRESPTPAAQQPETPSGLLDQAEKPQSPSATPGGRAANSKTVDAPAPSGAPAPAVGAGAAPVEKHEAQPVVTAAEPPPPAPKATPTPAVSEFQALAGARRQELRDRTTAETEAQKEKAADQRIDEDKRNVAAPEAARPAKGRGNVDATAAGAGAPVLQLGDVKKDSDDAETRTVAGRRFRKRGDVWVDTAYAGGGTVTYRRGSESYRGLVADEPEIRKIAEQLEGQIIVVWKGRTYRIQ